MFDDNDVNTSIDNSDVPKEEDDYENFFLQPATSPYKMAEKIAEANMLLLNENYESDREARVKFREVIADYEPDLTDDDVQSIESYNEVDFSIMEDPVELLKYQKDSFHDTIYETEEEEEEEIEEDTAIQDCQLEVTSEDKVEVKESEDEEDIIEEEECSVESTMSYEEDFKVKPAQTQGSLDCSEGSYKRCQPKISKARKVVNINCKNHCVESIPAASHVEKPNLACPTLKLHQRSCCDSKFEQKLPAYEGLRSEYGLSQAQLQKRERRRAVIRAKQEKRQELQDEFRKRRIQQNELIFCQWLREIAGREKPVAEKRRPKTADACGKNERAKRPHSTNCVYIQVPTDVLKKGIRIGEVLITKNQNIMSDKLHILRIS